MQTLTSLLITGSSSAIPQGRTNIKATDGTLLTGSCHISLTTKKVMFQILKSLYNYRGAYKSLDRPGRKEATATEDFDVHISYL
jgi:hypothetical protein